MCFLSLGNDRVLPSSEIKEQSSPSGPGSISGSILPGTGRETGTAIPEGNRGSLLSAELLGMPASPWKHLILNIRVQRILYRSCQTVHIYFIHWFHWTFILSKKKLFSTFMFYCLPSKAKLFLSVSVSKLSHNLLKGFQRSFEEIITGCISTKWLTYEANLIQDGHHSQLILENTRIIMNQLVLQILS